jgi:hypothetical protein
MALWGAVSCKRNHHHVIGDGRRQRANQRVRNVGEGGRFIDEQTRTQVLERIGKKSPQGRRVLTCAAQLQHRGITMLIDANEYALIPIFP